MASWESSSVVRRLVGWIGEETNKKKGLAVETSTKICQNGMQSESERGKEASQDPAKFGIKQKVHRQNVVDLERVSE